jgi:hypothetical protein
MVVSLFAPLPLGFVMMPGMALAALPLRAEKRGATPGRIVLLALPAQLYTAAVVTVWCMVVFTLLVIQAGEL